MADEFEQYAVSDSEFEQYAVPGAIEQRNQQNLMQKIMRYGIQDPIAGLAKGGRQILNLIPEGVRGLEGLAKFIRSQQKDSQAPEYGDVGGGQPASHPQMFPEDGKLWSQSVQQAINKVAPPGFDYGKAVGLEGAPSYLDKAIQGTAQYAPEIIGALDFGLPLVSRHFAAAPLRQASRMAAERNIGPLNISPELIEDARQFLPNTAPYRNMIEEAMGGDYDALFRLQSDLGKHSREYARNPFSAAERAHGRAGHVVRQDLLGAKAEELGRMGHQDIADTQRFGQQQYRRYMQARPYVRGAATLGGGAIAKEMEVPSYLRKLMGI